MGAIAAPGFLTNPHIARDAQFTTEGGASAPKARVVNALIPGGGSFPDYAVGLSYNIPSVAGGNFDRDDLTKPAIKLMMESYYQTSSELNLDQYPASSSTPQRPFGVLAAYDGTTALLGLGNSPYATGAGGITLEGGTTRGRLIGQAATGQTLSNPLIEMRRANGSVMMKLRPDYGMLQITNSASLDINATGFNGCLDLRDVSASAGVYAGVTTPASHVAFATAQAVTGGAQDANNRWQVRGDGFMSWGPGNATQDTTLYRSAADKLKTDDMLMTVLGLGVGNSAAATSLGSVVKKMQVFDASGASLGYVPIYDAIT